jgi:bifunctional non-homologous end joining protein LigD
VKAIRLRWHSVPDAYSKSNDAGRAALFDHPDWIYEINHDGFRTLAVIDQGHCRFFSRRKYRLTGYQELREALVLEVKAESAILNNELVVTDARGGTVFADMMQRRRQTRYFAFDLLWLKG